MTGHGAKFGRKKEQAIAALLTNRSVEDAAKVAGVATKTLVRWMRVPEFADAYRNARRQAFGQSIARLQQASSAAVSTLLKVMVDVGASPSTRLRAADSVLQHGARALELEEIEARLGKLERATQASSGTNRGVADVRHQSTAEESDSDYFGNSPKQPESEGDRDDESETQA